ncbi:DUF2463 domain-containing protein [Encephalitozoon intestinalis]|nr:DUF2463 domain-containing protein [Encephalitozoon intestinalis]UTX46567.1 DUF2463 domain-protein [Encephalitozoon intestinalis]
MLSIPISEKTTIRYSDHQESPKLNFHRLLDLYSFFATPISILIPLLMSMAFKQDTFESNSLLRFIFFAIPLSHLSLLNLRLLFSIKNSDKKSLFRSILHSVFRFLFFTFSIISILLIPMLYLNNPEDINFFSFFFLPLPISATYLLSTSCSLTPGHISFIDTGLNALVDILLLLSSLVSISICLDDEKEKFHPYLCVFSLLLLLLRSYNQRYNPSPKAEETTLWRKIFFLTILTIFLLVYIMAGIILFLLILEEYFKLPIPS